MSKDYRFGYEACLKYEQHLKKALDAYPNRVEFDYGNSSIETFTARFRDARKAFANGWQTSELFSAADVLIANDMVIVRRGNKVFAGSKRLIDASAPTIETDMQLDTVDNPSQEIIEAVITLISHGLFSRVTLLGVDESLATVLTEESDVSVSPIRGGVILY